MAKPPLAGRVRRLQWLGEHRALWAIVIGVAWGLPTGTLVVLWTSAPWPAVLLWVVVGCAVYGPLMVRRHVRRMSSAAVSGSPGAG